MSKKTKNPDTHSLISTLILLLVVIGIFFGIVPLLDQKNAVVEEINKKTIEKETLESKKQEIEKSKKELEEKGISKEDILNAIPEEINQGELIREIEKYTTQSNMELKNLSFSKKEEKDAKAKSITISTSLKGGFGDLMKFIKKIESSQRFMKIESLVIKKEDGEYAFSILIKTFYL